METLKNKNPKHNRLRLVYATGKAGKVESYFHVEHAEAERIIRIAKYINEKKDKISIYQMCKDLKMNRITLTRTLRGIAGVKKIDMQVDGKYKKLLGRILNIQKGMFHKKRNLSNVPPYMRPPITIERAPA